jgi:hypothetical protein
MASEMFTATVNHAETLMNALMIHAMPTLNASILTEVSPAAVTMASLVTVHLAMTSMNVQLQMIALPMHPALTMLEDMNAPAMKDTMEMVSAVNSMTNVPTVLTTAVPMQSAISLTQDSHVLATLVIPVMVSLAVMSTNVLLELTLAMPTLPAPIMTVVTAVHATKVLMETESNVMT